MGDGEWAMVNGQNAKFFLHQKITNHNSPFNIHKSKFTIANSPLPIHHSPLPIHHSPHPIHLP